MRKTVLMLGISMVVLVCANAAHAQDPCGLLTADDAAAAMGGPVTRVPAGPTNACYYQVRSPAGDGVSVQLIDGGRAKFDFDRGRILDTTALSGVGDAAFEFVSLAGFAQVYVIKGDTYFAITLTNHRTRNLAGSGAALARKIADRIKGK